MLIGKKTVCLGLLLIVCLCSAGTGLHAGTHDLYYDSLHFHLTTDTTLVTGDSANAVVVMDFGMTFNSTPPDPIMTNIMFEILYNKTLVVFDSVVIIDTLFDGSLAHFTTNKGCQIQLADDTSDANIWMPPNSLQWYARMFVHISDQAEGCEADIILSPIDGDCDVTLGNRKDYKPLPINLHDKTKEECCGYCTGGITGNTNCSIDGKITLSDISRTLDRVYGSKVPLCCPQNGNTDGSADGLVTLSDIARQIDAVYISRTPPAACLP